MTRNPFRAQQGARLAVAIGLSSWATLSCSFIVNDTSSKQCSVDADCTKFGGAFATSVCENSVCVASDPLSCRTVSQTNPNVKLTFTIGFAAKPKGDLGIFTVVACDRLDVDCASPVAAPATEDPSAPSANITLALPYGFQGYLQIENGTITVPSLEFLARPLQEDTAGWNLTMITPDTITALGLATNTTIDPMLGTFIMIARDCNRAPLGGVHATLDISPGDTDAGPDDPVAFYLANMFPTKSLSATTDEGAAGFANVPVGAALLSGTLQATGFPLQKTSALSRSGYISYVEVQP